MKRLLTIGLCLTIFSIYLSHSAFSQKNEEAFTILSPDTSLLSDGVMDDYYLLRNDTNVVAVEWTDLEQVDSIHEDGVIGVKIPNDTNLYEIETRFVSHDSLGYVWYGLPKDSVFGSFLFVKQDSLTFAYFNIKHRKFQIYESEDNAHILVEYDTLYDAGDSCLITGTGGGSAVSGNSRATCQDACVANIIFVHVDDVAELTPSVWQDARLAVEQFNMTVENSAIVNCRLRLRGVEFLNSVNQTVDNANLDLNNVSEDENVATWVNFYNADVVFLLVPDIYVDQASGVPFIGIARAFAASNQEEAIAAARIEDLVQRKVFTHEMGHLYNGRHIFDPTATMNNHAHIWQNSNFEDRFTVVAEGGLGDNGRIDHFSNPDVDFGGDPTGLTTRNNANVIEGHSCTMSNINTDGIFSICIKGDPSGEEDETVTLGMDVCHGTSPYIYHWEFSETGLPPWTSLGYGTTKDVTLSYDSLQWVYVRVEASDDIGRHAYDEHGIFIYPGLDEGAIINNPDIVGPPVVIGDIYPNPGKEIVQIPFTIFEEGPMQITAFHSDGTFHTIESRKFVKPGEYRASYTLPQPKSEFVVIEVKVKEFVTRKKLIILN